MSGKPLIKVLVLLMIGVSVLSACGGSDDPVDQPTAKPTVSRDANGFTPQQREVADAVKTYSKAFFGRGTSPVEPAIKKYVTKRLLDKLGPAESKAVDKAGLQYIGSVKLIPKQVTINGDKATFEGCQDGSRAFVVKKGEKTAGVGSHAVITSQLKIGMVRSHGMWLVDDPRGTATQAC